MWFARHKLPTTLDMDLLANSRDGRLFTPDLWKLEQHEWQLLFVTDNLMQRHAKHELIQPFLYEGRPLSSGFTAECFWGFWKKKLGKESFPVPLVNPNMRNTWYNKIGRIKGELVAIRPYMFIDLDKYYQNRLEFNRFRTNIIVPFRKRITRNNITIVSDEFTQTIRAWMYVGIPEFWDDQLDGGAMFSPVATFEPLPKPDKWPTGRYFYWSLNEYNDNRVTYPMS